MDSYKVFYCWQSDYDCTKTNDQKRESLSEQISQKVFIQRELESLAYKLGKEHKCNIVIDYDTDETPGMQPISDVVVEKIRKCHIFVCDLTPVITIIVNGRTKCMPNSNVMFELGVALCLLQPQQIIAIANKKEKYWKLTDLPFDIAHRQIITFTNSKDLDLKSALESSLKYLKSTKVKWRGYLNRISNTFNSSFKKKLRINELATLYNPEEFFRSRMAMSFPGIRGLMAIDINKLNVFFKDPITNVDVTPMLLIDKFGEHPIKQYKNLKKYRWFLIGDTEIDSPTIFVYRSKKNPLFNFLFIFSKGDYSVYYSCGIDNNYAKRTDDIEKEEVEEYAVFYEKKHNYNISKELYEDGVVSMNGKRLSGKLEFRRRYLKDNCLIIFPNILLYNQDSLYNHEIINQIKMSLKEINQKINNLKFKSIDKVLPLGYNEITKLENMFVHYYNNKKNNNLEGDTKYYYYDDNK